MLSQTIIRTQSRSLRNGGARMFASAPAPNQIRVPEGNIYADPASNFASRVKVGHDTYSRPTPSFSPQDSSSATTKGEVNPAHWAPPGSWPEEAVRSTTKANTLLTWAPSKAKNGMPIITRGEGVKLYDTNEKEVSSIFLFSFFDFVFLFGLISKYLNSIYLLFQFSISQQQLIPPQTSHLPVHRLDLPGRLRQPRPHHPL